MDKYSSAQKLAVSLLKYLSTAQVNLDYTAEMLSNSTTYDEELEQAVMSAIQDTQRAADRCRYIIYEYGRERVR